MGKYAKIKYAFVHNRTRRLRRDGTALVQIRAYQPGKNPKFFSTQVFIEPKFWDDRNKEVRSSHPSHFILNKQLRAQRESMEAYEIRMINQHGYFPVERLSEHEDPQKEIRSFTDFFAEELELATVSLGTLKNQRTTFNKLRSFSKKVFFEDLSYSFVARFDKYLFRAGLGVNTVAKHHRNLSKYITLAIRKNYLPPNKSPYAQFRPKKKEPKRVFLTSHELLKIEQVQFPESKKHLARIRDFFLICCWTGLRFSDVHQLSPAHIKTTDKGLQIHMASKKPGKFFVLPLYSLFRQEGNTNSKIESLVYKLMKDRFNTVGNDPAFDKIPFFGMSNQHINDELKEVEQYCKIGKNLTTHVGRRTFATMLATKVKMPILQKLLQHSTLDMVKIYVQLSNRDIENELEKIKWD